MCINELLYVVCCVAVSSCPWVCSCKASRQASTPMCLYCSSLFVVLSCISLLEDKVVCVCVCVRVCVRACVQGFSG